MSQLCWIPKMQLTPTQEAELISDLTIYPRISGFSDNAPLKKIQTFISGKTYLGVPCFYGRQWCDKHRIAVKDDTSSGFNISKYIRALPDPHHPSASQGQEEFFSSMLETVKANNTVLAEAPTGSGKTVTALNAIGRLGRSALIIVPNGPLMEQWKKEAIRHLGLKDEEVGVIGGGKSSWRDKPVVVAIIHNICMASMPDAFYRSFGITVWDEAHVVGAEWFSLSTQHLRSKYRIAITATPNRSDGCMRIVTDAFGPVAVKHSGNAVPVIYAPLSYSLPAKLRAWADRAQGKEMSRVLKALTADAARNIKIGRLALAGYKKNRNILLISDRISHLEAMHDILTHLGVPPEHIGMFSGAVKGDKAANGKKKLTKKQKLDDVVKNPKYRVILATYAMMKLGIDIPRLDMGIDISPKSEAVQTVGRIRRPFPNKPTPVWFTVVDSGRRFQALYRSREMELLSKGSVEIRPIKTL